MPHIICMRKINLNWNTWHHRLVTGVPQFGTCSLSSFEWCCTWDVKCSLWYLFIHEYTYLLGSEIDSYRGWSCAWSSCASLTGYSMCRVFKVNFMKINLYISKYLFPEAFRNILFSIVLAIFCVKYIIHQWKYYNLLL